MSARVPGLRVYKAQPTPEPSPGDYGLVEMPGAPAHLEAMLLGWRFYETGRVRRTPRSRVTSTATESRPAPR